MRVLTLAIVIAVTAVAVNATTGVALFDGSGATTEADRPSNQRLLGIHHFSLKDGVKPEDFERFIVEKWNPVMSDRFPGIHLMLVKGERNARDGEYLMVYDIQSVYVRDWYWPSSDEQTEASEAIWENCGEACSDVDERFASMAERTRWADYVELVRD
jgi:hypothetical protein